MGSIVHPWSVNGATRESRDSEFEPAGAARPSQEVTPTARPVSVDWASGSQPLRFRLQRPQINSNRVVGLHRHFSPFQGQNVGCASRPHPPPRGPQALHRRGFFMGGKKRKAEPARQPPPKSLKCAPVSWHPGEGILEPNQVPQIAERWTPYNRALMVI